MIYDTNDPNLWKKAFSLLKADKEYDLYQLYYRGKHRLAYNSEKWRSVFGRLFRNFSDNLCGAVVDAVCDRLCIEGFGLEKTEGEEAELIAQKVNEDIWQPNRMDFNAGRIHLNALRDGDSYVIVWPDLAGQPRIYSNEAALVRVCYDREIPGQINWAIKAWVDDYGKIRLTWYFADRIEKWVTRNKRQEMPERRDAFAPYDAAEGNTDDGTWPVVNPYGIVPVFHFANNTSLGNYGVSELDNAIPIQDALNKSVLDLLVGLEHVALPQRWVTGMEVEEDEITGRPKAPFTPGVDRLWISPKADVKFGQFDQADLSKVIAINDSFRMEMARVTGTPMHYFMLITDPPSGEALKALEARLIKKVKDRMGGFGNTWEDIIRFCWQITNGTDVTEAGVRFTTKWADPAPTSEKEKAETAEIKGRVGVPQKQLWKEMGYTDAEILEFEKEADLKAKKEMDAAIELANRAGSAPGGF